MKVTKELVWKQWSEVLSAYKYFWGEKSSSSDRKLIRAFFDRCVDMEYADFIKSVDEEYGALLANYRQAKHAKSIAAIKGILTFFLVLHIIGIAAGIIALLV